MFVHVCHCCVALIWLQRTKWPVPSERSRIQGDDVHQMATLNNCLPKILEMLAEPG